MGAMRWIIGTGEQSSLGIDGPKNQHPRSSTQSNWSEIGGGAGSSLHEWSVRRQNYHWCSNSLTDRKTGGLWSRDLA
eukprot:1660-Karenia_brevis.AAC.1